MGLHLIIGVMGFSQSYISRYAGLFFSRFFITFFGHNSNQGGDRNPIKASLDSQDAQEIVRFRI